MNTTTIVIICLVCAAAALYFLGRRTKNAASGTPAGNKNPATSNIMGLDALTVSDWLRNLFDGIIEIVQSENLMDNHSSRRLALFVESASIKTTDGALHQVPSAVRAVPDILKEARLYFNCAWQLYLLMHFDDRPKVARLFPLVDGVEQSFWRSVFESNERIHNLLNETVTGTSLADLRRATVTYIQGKHTPAERALLEVLRPSAEQSNAFTDGAMLFSMKIVELIEETGAELDQDQKIEVLRVCAEAALEAFANRLLTEFDLDQCEVVEFPEDFYER